MKAKCKTQNLSINFLNCYNISFLVTTLKYVAGSYICFTKCCILLVTIWPVTYQYDKDGKFVLQAWWHLLSINNLFNRALMYMREKYSFYLIMLFNTHFKYVIRVVYVLKIWRKLGMDQLFSIFPYALIPTK